MTKRDIPKPFLRWAGGKSWLTNQLSQLLKEKSFEGYIEPFLGGASVFLSLQPPIAFLSDSNADLINTYICVKEQPDAVYDLLKNYKNTAEEYYAVRSNNPSEPVERAARFIYLNQASFNGLYRVNRKGEYNVPYGKRKVLPFSYENLLAVSERLANAELVSCDFEEAISKVKKGMLVYLDPPYVVAKDDKGFIGYNQQLFSIEDQKRLGKCIDHIKEVGAFYILSNAKHESIREIFDKGDTIMEVERTSLIGGKKAYRGKTLEYLFTNVR